MIRISKLLRSQTLYPHRSKLILILIILAAAIIRIIYFSGLVFSDDSYYDQLACSLLNGGYSENYIGYPIFLLRKVHSLLTAFSFLLFGKNEIASVIFPFLFSIGGVYLTYKFTYFYSKSERASLLAAFFIALLPTDVIFATINFADLQAAFIVNLGLYFLFKSYRLNNNYLALFSATLFYLSVMIKPVFINLFVLIFVFYIYRYLKYRENNKQILICLILFFGLFVFEGLFYTLAAGDPLYRFTIMSENFKYAYYDFFPNYFTDKPNSFWDYSAALFDQIFIYNSKYLFFRRFYLFVPLISLVVSIIFLLRNKHKIIIYWFIGLSVLMMAFTTSITAYIPMNLRSSWYAFPLFLPAVILIALFLMKFNWKILTPVLIIYAAGSLIMINSYKAFFDSENLNSFKKFLKKNKNEVIYTDHHTKYGIDLIDNYELPLRSKVINKNLDFERLEKGELVIYNQAVISELKLQGHKFPEFTVLNNSNFEKINSFGKFIIFEKR